jgi:hypothetical protein
MVVLALLFEQPARAQISHGGTPYSFTHQVQGGSAPVATMRPVDESALRAEDRAARQQAAQQDSQPKPPRFGAALDVSLGIESAGQWTALPDTSGRLWRLRISSPGAHSINLIFDRFHLPPGGKLFIYNRDRSTVLGAFTEANNKSYGRFSTLPVEGETITLEYYEPQSQRGNTLLRVSKVIHAYRDFFGQESGSTQNGFGDSASCHNNVNCSKGDDWQDEKRAVAMVLLDDGTRWCSGALVNNEREDLTPYFLSAFHCADGDDNRSLSSSEISDAENWTFWFNYESLSCTNPNHEPGHDGISGASLKASNSASDFLLLELSSTPPSRYGTYYAGWTAKSNPPRSSVVGIHHPRTDIKKISFDDERVSSNDRRKTWVVDDWDDGTTEKGSSGSPLFNQNSRIIGQDSYGTSGSPCGSKGTGYGKFSYSWDHGLSDYLDPDGTGIRTLDGTTGRFQAAIYGPGWVAPNTSATWKALVPGEPANYNYRWYYDDDNDGYTDTGVTSKEYSRSDDDDFELKVKAQRGTQSSSAVVKDPAGKWIVHVGPPSEPYELNVPNAGQHGEHPQLEWNPSIGELDHYNVWRCYPEENSSGCPYTQPQTHYEKIGTTSDTSYTDREVTIETQDCPCESALYVVTAKNQYGESGSAGPFGVRHSSRSGSSTKASAKAEPRPEAFALEGNVPNPFREQTRLRFALPEAARVQLVVYDVRGREVSTLIDEQMGPGFHHATFDASGLASGVYVYRFRAGETFAKTGKMVLVK